VAHNLERAPDSILAAAKELETEGRELLCESESWTPDPDPGRSLVPCRKLGLMNAVHDVGDVGA